MILPQISASNKSVSNPRNHITIGKSCNEYKDCPGGVLAHEVLSQRLERKLCALPFEARVERIERKPKPKKVTGQIVCIALDLDYAFQPDQRVSHFQTQRLRLGSDGDLNLDTSLDVDDDLLDDLGGGVQVDQTLVDSVNVKSARDVFHNHLHVHV